MKKLILLLYLILTSVISIKAQITAAEPICLILYVVNQSEDLNTNINIGSSGQGQSWDFYQLSLMIIGT